jgi:hypothetical protein
VRDAFLGINSARVEPGLALEAARGGVKRVGDSLVINVHVGTWVLVTRALDLPYMGMTGHRLS